MPNLDEIKNALRADLEAWREGRYPLNDLLDRIIILCTGISGYDLGFAHRQETPLVNRVANALRVILEVYDLAAEQTQQPQLDALIRKARGTIRFRHVGAGWKCTITRRGAVFGSSKAIHETPTEALAAALVEQQKEIVL